MRTLVATVLVLASLVAVGHAQKATEGSRQESSTMADSHAPSDRTSEAADLSQLKADVQHLKVLLNQMRTNLAFVQTSQTPLKHQFELEADAWQVIVEQMDRRLEKMEKSEHTKPGQK